MGRIITDEIGFGTKDGHVIHVFRRSLLKITSWPKDHPKDHKKVIMMWSLMITFSLIFFKNDHIFVNKIIFLWSFSKVIMFWWSWWSLKKWSFWLKVIILTKSDHDHVKIMIKCLSPTLVILDVYSRTWLSSNSSWLAARGDKLNHIRENKTQKKKYFWINLRIFEQNQRKSWK